MMKFPRLSMPVVGFSLTLIAGLAGCSTEELYSRPFFNFSSSYQSAPGGAPVLMTNDAWWEKLNDKTLNALITRALHGNIDLRIARERVVEAYAGVESVSPQGQMTPSASVRRQGGVGANSSSETRSEAALGVNWLFDPYGLRRQQIQAAGARVEVADAEVDAARLMLILNMTNAYVDLRFNQRLLALRRQQLASRRQTFGLTQTLFETGASTKVEITRTEALVTETQTQIPPLQAQIQSRKNEIAVLAGMAPGTLGIDLDGRMHQPNPNMSPKTGIPADLLRNRPDIRIAERSYYAAVSEIGVARAALYPQLSLGGSIGPAREGGSQGIDFFFGPSIVFPSLLDTTLKARVAARHSQARQAHETWKATVLVALREVENARAAYEGSARSVSSARRTAQLYREALDLTRDQMGRGDVTIRDMISAEEDIADADVVLADTIRQLAINFVQLNVSVGAGSDVSGDGTGAVPVPIDQISMD